MHSPKKELLAQLARIGNALSSEVRLEMIELLAQGECSVEQLARMTQATTANVSQHLQRLRQAGLVESRKQGLYVFYRLAGDEVVKLMGVLGEVGGKRKAVLLARARCLWMPAQWDEPFGLPTIEALFSGTPVLGTRRGALPEIVTPDVGVLRDTLEELIAVMDTVGSLDPEACRTRAERHFTPLVMAEAYARMYQTMVSTGKLPPGKTT